MANSSTMSACEALWRFFNRREQKELFYGKSADKYQWLYPKINGFLRSFQGRGACWAELEPMLLDYVTTPSGDRAGSYGFWFFLGQKLKSPKWDDKSRYAELISFAETLRYSALGMTSVFPGFITELQKFMRAEPQCAAEIKAFLDTPFNDDCFLRLMFPHLEAGMSIENATPLIKEFCDAQSKKKQDEKAAAAKQEADRQAELLKLKAYLREKFSTMDLAQFKELGPRTIEEEIRKELALKLGTRYQSGMYY